MKTIFLFTALIASVCHGQKQSNPKTALYPIEAYVKSVDNLTLDAAFELTKRVTKTADSLDKKVTIAILDASGIPILTVRGDGVGPHNTEAARRKAFTALSTKTPTLLLLRNAELNPDTKNLNTLPELLLLSGGTPIWYKGSVIGSVGIAGGGSAENDDLLAKSASIPEMGITTTK
jgi:uncharacterized protein GlcG (DUF336 family)